MLTLLSITDMPAGKLSEKIKALFKPYHIETKINKSGDISIMDMKYYRLRGKIRYDKIYELCIGKRKTLLCSRDTDLDGTFFHRFDDKEFRMILMGNYICEALTKADIAPSDLRISYYDPHAQYPSLLGRLTHFADMITVVSDMPRFYENEAERLSDENGAVINVSNDPENLNPCNILIAPEIIEKSLPITQVTPIFTIAQPAAPCRGTVITDYHASLPQEYSTLRNSSFLDEYIMAAIYSLCGKKKLGSTIPYSCSNSTDIFFLEGTVRLIRASCSKNT